MALAFLFQVLSLHKTFTAGISYQTDEQSLKEAFAKYGEIIEGM